MLKEVSLSPQNYSPIPFPLLSTPLPTTATDSWSLQFLDYSSCFLLKKRSDILTSRVAYIDVFCASFLHLTECPENYSLSVHQRSSSLFFKSCQSPMSGCTTVDASTRLPMDNQVVSNYHQFCKNLAHKYIVLLEMYLQIHVDVGQLSQ